MESIFKLRNIALAIILALTATFVLGWHLGRAEGDRVSSEAIAVQNKEISYCLSQIDDLNQKLAKKEKTIKILSTYFMEDIDSVMYGRDRSK